MAERMEDIFDQMKNLTEEEILARLEGLSDEGGVAEEGTEETQEPEQKSQSTTVETAEEGTKDEPVQNQSAVTQQQTQEPVNPVNSQEQKEMSAVEILETDPVFRYLSSLSPAERVKWASTYGEAGQARLMEFMELQQQALVEQMQQSQVETTYQVLISEWADANKDLLADEESALITEGIDIALMRKKGYEDYTQMSPTELRAHLEEVAQRARQALGKGGDVRGQEEPKPQGGDETGGSAVRDPVGRVGDLGAGTTQGSELDALLAKAASDPMALEELVTKLPQDRIESLLSKLES